MAGPLVRLARAADLPAVREIAGSYGNLDDWPGRPDYLDLELEQGALWVAELDGAVTGFAAVLVDGPIAHLADLFIRRDARSGGIGAALLRATLPADRVLTTFASGDERALPLYARFGMRPLAPVLYLAGSIPGAARAERVPVAQVVAGDAAASGRERPAALELIERAGGYALAGAGGGHALVRPAPGGGWIGPGAGDVEDVLAFVRAVSAAHGGVELLLPGPHPALRPLLEAGFRILGMDTYMASQPGLHDLERYLPHPDLG